MENSLIDISRVARIFGKSVRVLRDYKRLGIIVTAEKDGMKDLYDQDDCIWAAQRLKELVRSTNVSEAGDVIVRERKKNRRE